MTGFIPFTDTLRHPVFVKRGTRIVTDTVRQASLFYNRDGALIGAWAARSGIDPAGNPYPAGYSGLLGVLHPGKQRANDPLHALRKRGVI